MDKDRNELKNENLKIREDALKIKEKDLQDTLQSIEMENRKTIAAIGFEAILVSLTLNAVTKMNFGQYFFFGLMILISTIVSFYNLFAKKVAIHTDVDEIFIRKEDNNDWDRYIDYKYLRIKKSYEDAQKLLVKKAVLTIWTFVFLSIAILTVLIGGVYGIR